jgi:hypothetical protein
MDVDDAALVVDLIRDRGDDQRPDGDRGDEVAVHDVDVDHVRAGVHHLGHLPAEAGEVGRQDRGRDADVVRELTAGRRHSWRSMLAPQWLQLSIAVLDMRTMVECSPQLGHSETSSNRFRQ